MERYFTGVRRRWVWFKLLLREGSGEQTVRKCSGVRQDWVGFKPLVREGFGGKTECEVFGVGQGRDGLRRLVTAGSRWRTKFTVNRPDGIGFKRMLRERPGQSVASKQLGHGKTCSESKGPLQEGPGEQMECKFTGVRQGWVGFKRLLRGGSW